MRLKKYLQVAALGLSLLVTGSTAARGEIIDMNRLLKGEVLLAHLQWLTSDALIQELSKVGTSMDRRLHPQTNCRDQYQVKTKKLYIYESINFPDDAVQPVSGMWGYRFEFARCGDTKVYNAIMQSSAEKGLKIAPLPPGETIADLILVKDVINPIFFSADSRQKFKCTAAQSSMIAEVKVSQPPQRLVEDTRIFDRVWEEVWTVRLCNRDIPVTVCFMQDSAEKPGTTWNLRTCQRN